MRFAWPIVAVWVLAGAGSTRVISTHTWISTGPTLAGARIGWATGTPRVVLYVSDPIRRVWRAGPVAVPADAQDDPRFDVRVSQRISTVAGSSRRIALIRSIDLQLIPRCGSQEPPCLGPVRSRPFRGEVWAGRTGGPLRRVAGAPGRPIALNVDVDGEAIVYSDKAVESRVVLLRPGARKAVLTSSSTLEFPAVAVAGRYVGWLEQPRDAAGLYVPRALAIYDLRERRLAYRLEPDAFVPGALVAFDLAGDGTVAFGADPTPTGGCDGGIGWASTREPRPHFLPGDAIPFRVRIAVGRIAFFTRTCNTPTPFALVVESLGGKVVGRPPAAYGEFDAAGNKIAYLSNQKEITVARLP